MRICIVIPAYNEDKTISNVIRKARKYGDVMVVNDASTDDTEDVARKAGALIISHKINRGLGGSLRTGFAEALKKGYDTVVTLDADGQHDPDEIPKFTDKINDGYDFVLGKRDLTEYPFVKKFGNFFLNKATNALSGTSLNDTEGGFRAFSRSALKKLDLKAERYQIAVEIIREIGRNKLKACNVDVKSPVYRKGVGVRDGMGNFIYLLRK